MTFRSIGATMAGGAAALMVFMSAAAAQLDNRPYSFGDSGPGMSNAARQAIIRKELFGETPDNLVRSPGGRLLQLREGPGNSAIVSTPGGEVIPGYRGTSIFRRELGEGAGIFNAFFGPGRSSSGYYGAGAFFIGGAGTRTSIAGWTDMVSDGGPTGYIPAGPNPIDGWTSQVFIYFAN